ncbi:hypothetical protein HDU93_005470 [Gonapodya sp. JEL0774]|nr:hypothetical protein HDU93_005470 [Gonapodya sp. JEL0774]
MTSTTFNPDAPDFLPSWSTPTPTPAPTESHLPGVASPVVGSSFFERRGGDTEYDWDQEPIPARIDTVQDDPDPFLSEALDKVLPYGTLAFLDEDQDQDDDRDALPPQPTAQDLLAIIFPSVPPSTVVAALERHGWDWDGAVEELLSNTGTGTTRGRTENASVRNPAAAAAGPCKFYLAGWCGRADCGFSHDLGAMVLVSEWMVGCVSFGIGDPHVASQPTQSRTALPFSCVPRCADSFKDPCEFLHAVPSLPPAGNPATAAPKARAPAPSSKPEHAPPDVQLGSAKEFPSLAPTRGGPANSPRGGGLRGLQSESESREAPSSTPATATKHSTANGTTRTTTTITTTRTGEQFPSLSAVQITAKKAKSRTAPSAPHVTARPSTFSAAAAAIPPSTPPPRPTPPVPTKPLPPAPPPLTHHPDPASLPWLPTGSAASAEFLKERNDAEQHAVARNRCFQMAAEMVRRGDGRGAKVGVSKGYGAEGWGAIVLKQLENLTHHHHHPRPTAHRPARKQEMARLGHHHQELSRQAHARASERIFASRNRRLAQSQSQSHTSGGAAGSADPTSTPTPTRALDLHGLLPHEAVSKLSLELSSLRNARFVGHVVAVTGTGHHSQRYDGGKPVPGATAKGGSKVFEAVARMLNEEGWAWREGKGKDGRGGVVVVRVR